MNSTQKKLFKNLLALILCFVMLTGTTFAWFTDSAVSTGNVVKAGNLKIDMLWTDDLEGGQWHSVDEEGYNTLFNNETNWEPGYTEVRYIKIKNTGDLAFNFDITLEKQGTAEAKLAEVIQVYAADNVTSNVTERTNLGQNGFGSVGMLDAMMNGGKVIKGTLLPANQQSTEHKSGETVIAIALQMITTAGNEYQSATLGEGFKIKALATQCTYESDSFDKNYDNGATPGATITATSVTTPVSSVNGVVEYEVTMTGNGITAKVPAGAALADGVSELKLTVNPLHDSESGITAVNDEMLIPVDIHIDGLAENNNVPVIIELGEILPKYLNMGNYKLFHIEDSVRNEMTYVADAATLNAHNQFTYDTETGAVTVAMATFSEVALFADAANVWKGEFDYSWYTNAVVAAEENATVVYEITNADQLAGFGAIVGGMNGQKQDDFSGKTVKLIADVNLGYGVVDTPSIFYPIGYYNSTKSYERTNGSVTSNVSSFKGTFDGNGHTISNFYQNTWEMFGGYNDGYSAGSNYYKDAMGLFGYVLNGTVKNLTVSNFSSDGEFTPTGVIAAYAVNSTFENIAITNCNPRVYNTGNGGIIGIAGNSNDQGTKITLKNITVDNSNKISALWGSYDVACGGLVGMFRGNADGGNGKIHFENCHVSAIIDVYNDVCANYQYYAYRYSGMMIGSVRHNTINEGKTIPNMAGISASGCTVNYGDWNDYYYCEFEKNTMASYSEDYQFSRVPHSELNFTDSNGNGVVDADERASVTGCKHTHTAEENHQAIYLPFHQLFTGYSWGVSSIGIEELEGIENITVEIGQEESVNKFNGTADGKTYMTGTTVKIRDLFTVDPLNQDVDINESAIMVSVTPANATSTANGIYTANADPNEWEEGTIKFSGTGAATITITDYYFCKPTTITVTIAATEKFKSKFKGDFLYRVGNKNEVALGSLFEKNGDVEIDDVSVMVNNLDGTEAAFAYTSNDEWTNGKIRFEQTGVVSITISEAGSVNCVLNLEIVDGYNVTTASGGDYPLINRNSVLLNDITMATNGNFWLENATLYGNGFKFDVTAGKDGDTTNGYIGGNYAIALKNATLDNVQIIGDVYTEYGAGAKDMYNYPTILTNGNSIIANSYVSNGSAAVRAQDGNLQIINSTLEGGIFANLDIRGGTVTLDNVITINQSNADGSSTSNDKGIVGLGIAFYECNLNAKLIVETDKKGDPLLKQYNCMSEKVNVNDTTVNSLKNAMFGTSHKDLQYTDSSGIKWVNTGIMSATVGLGQANIDEIKGYTGKKATVAGQEGYVYTPIPNATTVEEQPDAYCSTQQYVVLPTVNFDHEAEKNYKAPSVDSNEHCYYNNDTKKLEISFDEGKNKVYDPNILTITKAGETLPYTVKINDVDYTGKTITFDTAGKYTAVYTYTDPYNFKLEDDRVTTYNAKYTKEIEISVSVVEATAKDAEFTFYGYSSISKTPAVTITDVKTVTSDSGNLYIMPESTGTNVTSKTIDGITVNCPRVYVDFKDNSSDFNWMYPVFLGVKIEDYSDGGTAETATTIVSPTSTSKPANLTILTVDKPTGGGGWSSGSGKSGSEGNLSYKNGTYNGLYGWTSGALGSDQPANSIYCQFTYKDNKGTTYYYVIEFYRAKHTCPSCVTPDTLITLVDGSQVRVDSLTGKEQLLVWNMETGALDSASIMFNDSEAEAEFDVINLTFSDGTTVDVIGEHGFWDYDLNRYVYLDRNAEEYVGHWFAKQNGDELERVQLIDVVIETELTTAWSPVTEGHLCYFVNGMLSMPGGVGGLFNIFDVDAETMTYDFEAMARDIEAYGLFTYEELSQYAELSEDMFYNAGGPFLKVSMAKGNLTEEELIAMIQRYGKYFE